MDFRNYPLRKVRLLTLALLVLVVVAKSAEPQKVTLTVDYADGIQKRFEIPFTEGMTVFDMMNSAQATGHGLKYRYQGEGGPPQEYLLTQIDDVGQTDGDSPRYWFLWVNEKHSDKGFGICKVGPGDHVLWRFGIDTGGQVANACR